MQSNFSKSISRADVEACASIDAAMGFEANISVLLRAHQDGRLLVAKQDSQVIGYLRYGFLWDDELAIIQMIRVKPDHKGMGYGKKLIELLESELKKQDVEQVLSSTDESNTNSYEFHKALGFEECGSLDINADGIREIFFKKRWVSK